MKRIFSFAVAALLLTTSCSKESAVGIDNGDNLAGGAALSFTFNHPIGNYTTYAIAEGTEWDVHTLKIFAYGTTGPVVVSDSDYNIITTGAGTAAQKHVVTMTADWVLANPGKILNFYFVGNDDDTVPANAATNAPHLTTAPATEDDLLQAKTNPLVDGTNNNNLYEHIKTPLLFSSEAIEVTVPTSGGGKVTKDVTLKRREARFDIVNTVPTLTIGKVMISGANQQGYLFADADVTTPGNEISSFAKVSMEEITTIPTFVTEGGESISKSVFYLYPTNLDDTKIYIEGMVSGSPQTFVVDSNIDIVANKRYKLVAKLEANDIIFTVTVADYEEGAPVDALPITEAGVARTGFSVASGASTLVDETCYVTGAATLTVTVTSTTGTTASANPLLGTTNPGIAVSAPASSTTYGLQVTDVYTITVPAEANAGFYDLEVKFTSKGNAADGNTKSTFIRIVRMENKAVEGILAYEDGGAGLNLDGLGVPLFFKWGSLIGTDATKPVGSEFSASDAIYLGGFTGTITTWAEIPFGDQATYPDALPAQDLEAGRGDPCQLIPGYRMPTGPTYELPTAGHTWGMVDNMFGRSFGGNFYPAAGHRGTNGVVYTVGRLGYYWSSTPNEANAYSLHIPSGGVSPSDSRSRSCGFLVRCVAE